MGSTPLSAIAASNHAGERDASLIEMRATIRALGVAASARHMAAGGAEGDRELAVEPRLDVGRVGLLAVGGLGTRGVEDLVELAVEAPGRRSPGSSTGTRRSARWSPGRSSRTRRRRRVLGHESGLSPAPARPLGEADGGDRDDHVNRATSRDAAAHRRHGVVGTGAGRGGVAAGRDGRGDGRRSRSARRMARRHRRRPRGWPSLAVTEVRGRIGPAGPGASVDVVRSSGPPRRHRRPIKATQGAALAARPAAS